MKVSNSNYDTYNGLISNPRFLLEFDSLTNEYATGEFSGRTSTQLMLLKHPRIGATEIQPLQPSGQFLGRLNCGIVDESGEILDIIANNTMYGRRAVLSGLFEELADTDAIELFGGQVVNYEQGDDLLSFDFEIESVYQALEKTVFTDLAETNLDGQVAYLNLSTTMNAAVSSGSDVWIALNTNHPLEEGDQVYIEDDGTPSTNEMTLIKETRVNTGTLTTDVKCDLTNNYVINSVVSTQKIRVDSASEFLSSVPANPPYQDGMNFLIGNEIIKYNGRSTTVFTLDASRTYFGSERQAHTDNQKVKEVRVIRDNPIDLMLGLLLTTSGGGNSSYDYAIDNFGAGIDELYVDITAAENIKTTWFASDDWRYIIDEATTVHDLLKDIWTGLGIFPVITQGGILSFRKVRIALPALSIDSIDDDDIWFPDDSGGESDDVASVPVRWTPGIDQLLNEVEFKYDWLPGRNEFLTTRTFELADSKTAFGLTRRMTIQCKGVRTGLVAVDNFTTGYLKILAKRYGNPPPRLEMALNYPKHLLEAGDYVDVSSDILPNMQTGARDLSGELLELVKVEPEPESGKVNIAGYFYNQVSTVDLGTNESVQPADGAANFNATDSASVQADDATYDNSAGLNVSATRITITVRITIPEIIVDPLNSQILGFHLRVGSGVDTATMTVEDDQDISFGYLSGKYPEGHRFYATYIFEFVSAAVRDVKLDYYSRSGGDAANIDAITIHSILFEQDGAEYTEIT